MARTFFNYSFFISTLYILLDFVAGESYPTATYTLLKDFQAGSSNFFNNFNFYTGADPTNGFVE
jgi:hypothetical protein